MSNLSITAAALEKMKKAGGPHVLYMASRGGWGGCVYIPAVRAGKPAEENDFEKTEIESIPFYIRKDMVDKKYSISWVGFWVFGQYVVEQLDHWGNWTIQPS